MLVSNILEKKQPFFSNEIINAILLYMIQLRCKKKLLSSNDSSDNRDLFYSHNNIVTSNERSRMVFTRNRILFFFLTAPFPGVRSYEVGFEAHLCSSHSDEKCVEEGYYYKNMTIDKVHSTLFIFWSSKCWHMAAQLYLLQETLKTWFPMNGCIWLKFKRRGCSIFKQEKEK